MFDNILGNSLGFLYFVGNNTQWKDNVVHPGASLHATLGALSLGAHEHTGILLEKYLGFDFSELLMNCDHKIRDRVRLLLPHDGSASSHIKVYYDFHQFNPAYVKAAMTVFRTEMERIKFSHKEEAMTTVNRWVKEKTHGLIKWFFETFDVNIPTSLVLVNTLYFKARWLKGFDIKNSLRDLFYLANGSAIKQNYMVKESKFRYLERTGYQMLAIPYKDDSYVAVFILPDRNSSVEKILSMELGPLIEELLKGRRTHLRVKIPKLYTSAKVDLKDYLEFVGLQRLFDRNNRELTQIYYNDTCVEKIAQAAYLEMNEDGTVATGPTSEVLYARYSVKHFQLNRPYVVLIWSKLIKAPILSAMIMYPNN